MTVFSLYLVILEQLLFLSCANPPVLQSYTMVKSEKFCWATGQPNFVDRMGDRSIGQSEVM